LAVGPYGGPGPRGALPVFPSKEQCHKHKVRLVHPWIPGAKQNTVIASTLINPHFQELLISPSLLSTLLNNRVSKHCYLVHCTIGEAQRITYVKTTNLVLFTVGIAVTDLGRLH